MGLGYAWTCKFCSKPNEPDADSCTHCGKPAVASPAEVAQVSHVGPANVSLVAFAIARKRVLWPLFALVVALVVGLMICEYAGLFHFEESGGWLLFLGSLPWSIFAIVFPALGVLAIPIVVVGLGFNAVAVTTIIWWWFDNLRGSNNG